MAIDYLRFVAQIDVESLGLFNLIQALRFGHITIKRLCVDGPKVFLVDVLVDVLRVMSTGGHQGASSYDGLLFRNLELLFLALLFQLLVLLFKMRHLLDQVFGLVIFNL